MTTPNTDSIPPSSSSSASAADSAMARSSADTPVSQAQLDRALAQVARMQQETMQNVQHMQATLHQFTVHSHSLSGANHPPPNSHAQSVPLTTALPGAIKLAKPSLFTGATKANVETWLFEVEQYLMAYGVRNESQQIAVAASSFKGLQASIGHPALEPRGGSSSFV